MVLLFANFCQPSKMGVTSILNEVRVCAGAMYAEAHKTHNQEGNIVATTLVSTAHLLRIYTMCTSVAALHVYKQT